MRFFFVGYKRLVKKLSHIYTYKMYMSIFTSNTNRIWMHGISVNNNLLAYFQFQVYNSMIFRQKYQQDLKTCISAYTNHLWYGIALL